MQQFIQDWRFRVAQPIIAILAVAGCASEAVLTLPADCSVPSLHIVQDAEGYHHTLEFTCPFAAVR